MAHSTYTQSIKLGNNNSNSGNTIESYNKTVYNKTVIKSDEDAQIMHWLSPLEPKNRHQGVRTDRFEGVGNWLLEIREFREWREGEGGADKAVLFCSGNPGVGKTYLSSLVIDSLCDQPGDIPVAVACLYYDFLAQNEQSITNMVGAILKQLVGGGDIETDIRESFKKGKKELGGRGLLHADLMRMLKVVIASLPQVFICIDALDECLPKNLPELLESLRDILRESPTTRIFLTGRPHVREAILRYFTGAVVVLISPNTNDVRNYLQIKLSRDEEPEAMDDDLREDIVETILDKMSDIFLLVSLKIEAILGEVTISQRRRKLEEMARGNGLSDAYTTTLTRLKGQKGNKSVLGWKVLMWVLYSEWPLRAKELCHALAVEIGSTDLDRNNLPALGTLLASCLGLVTVEESSSIVRLVHFTLQEHLLNDPTLFQSPHSMIAEVCLTYLNFGCIRDLSPTLASAPSEMSLLKYASCYWGDHAIMGMTENVKILALRLLEKFDEHISAGILLWHYTNRGLGPYFDYAGGPLGFTGLHGVSFLGIVEIVVPALQMKEWDVNAFDCMGSTALIWAARTGNEEVVKILLERGDVNPDLADTEYGQTPLSWAAGNGHERVVKMLLERDDVNPDQPDQSGRTPLSWAAENSHEEVVKMLLERGDVSPDLADTEYGQTPLSWAVKNGHERVVRTLLERDDVNPDQPDKSGRTPLWLAVGTRHEEVVKMLLERGDVNPDLADTKYGQTPLSWAAKNGHERVVRMLLERDDVNPDQPDKSGRTPLWRAVGARHEEVVKMLLEREDVNPGQAVTEYGQTPLSWAAGNGHERVVKMLLERDDVNPDQPDKSGQTPLSWAAKNGREGVVARLLERDDVNSDQSDNSGRTPLSWAAENGHEEVVKMLLERGDVNPDQADTQCGQTPLSWAAENGREGVVARLLERDDVNPDQPDKSGQTPLSWAAEDGREGVVARLLERHDVNPDQSDKSGRTPLSWAAENGHEEVVNMLLEREDVNSDHVDTEFGRTPLSWAAVNGHREVVEMLLEREDVNSDHVDTKYGRTPLSWAAFRGHSEVVKILLERGDVNPDQPDTKYGLTPLSWAAVKGYGEVVEMLLEREDINSDHVDTKYGRTPLLWAAMSGHEGTAKMLLERRDVNPDLADTKYGRTPLSWAAFCGHREVVKILLERQDVRATALDHDNQTPLSLALSGGHDEVVRILRDNAHSHTTDRSGHASLPPPAEHGDRRVVDMESRIYDPNNGTIDLNAHPPSQSDDPCVREGVSGPKGPLTRPADSEPSSPRPPKRRQFRALSS